MTTRLSRRSLLKSSVALAAAPLVLPRWYAYSPLATLDVACIGVGGMGGSDLASVAACRNVRIAALCDVDRNHLDAAAKLHPDAKTFADYRRLFDAMGKEIDAVVVSTPDHMHGSIAIAAMQLGKHVYCQKPIAHNLYECRRMAELAAKHRLVTQMGTQIHAHEAYRTAVATLQSGVLGRIKEAHLWVGKSWAGPANGRPDKTDPVPAELAWDLWLGVAPERPFVQDIYHPANWRGWLDFGSGTLGDMGCHIFDPVFTALGIGAPLDVVSRGPQHHAETFAGDEDVLYTFPATERTVGALPFRWTDGGVAPDVAKAQLPKSVGVTKEGKPKECKLPGSGSFVVGEKGVMVLPHWAMPSFYRDGEVLDVELQQHGARNHYEEWTDACRGEGATSTPFAYAGPLTEAVLLGTIAGRFKDRLLKWDSARLRFDHDGANALVKRSYREGWRIE
ncbi:MAG TPA: Gfo/Idh/MocA family oxidoreductase [Planctomycetota bacterium]|nr:Gfo/Idh/MocA family oxidoreductase [Planctomycetota bacterium]